MAKRLTVRLQVWHSFCESVPSDFADTLNEGMGRNWASYTQSHEFPWTWRLVEKELSSQELEDTERVYLEIHFKHKTYNQDDPCQYVVIKQLCDTLLDPSEALNLASIDNSDAVSFIPTSRGVLSQADIDFGIAFCVSLVERSKGKPVFREGPGKFFTRNPTKWFRGPLHAIVFVTDVLIWFKPHIEKLEAMFRGRFSRARDEERAAILFDYMRIAAPMSASIKGWAVCRLEELKPENVEQQIDQALRPFRQAALDSLTTLQHLNAQNTISIADLEIAIHKCTTLINCVPALGHASITNKDAAFGRVVTRGTLTTILGGGSALLYCNPTTAIPATVVNCLLGVLGTGTLVSGGMTIWSAIDYWACAKAVSAIYDVGSTCHQIWLFMTLFFMRVKGLVHEDDEQFMEFTNMMAKSFGGIDVRELWRDQTYVSEWLRTETARLEKVYESI